MSLENVFSFQSWDKQIPFFSNVCDDRVRFSSNIISNLIFLKRKVFVSNVKIFSCESVSLVNDTKSNDVDQNQESRKYSGKWSAEIDAEQDLKGSFKADASFKVEQKLNDDFSWSFDVGGVLKQDKNKEIEIGLKGNVKFVGEF